MAAMQSPRPSPRCDGEGKKGGLFPSFSRGAAASAAAALAAAVAVAVAALAAVIVAAAAVAAMEAAAAAAAASPSSPCPPQPQLQPQRQPCGHDSKQQPRRAGGVGHRDCERRQPRRRQRPPGGCWNH